jgi:Dullard-like phosphatase family protein
MNNNNNNKNERNQSPKKKNKKNEIINIEDLLLLDENFIEVINSISTNFNLSNNCFEFFNIYINSSLNCNFEKYFTDYQSNIIIHISIMIMLFNIIITYHISFSPQFLNIYSNFLKNLIILSHKSFLLICNLISNVVSSSAQENICVKKLRKILEENIIHPQSDNKEFKIFLSSRNLKLVNNITVDSLIEIKFYSYLIKKYLKILLNIINDKDILKNDFCNLFNDIDKLSFNCLNDFYISKVLRIINKNASVTGKNASSYGGMMAIYNIKVPYLDNIRKKKFTLVLDLDETLIAFKINQNQDNGLLKFRPGIDYFLLKMKNIYEIVVFTSATQEYADPIINCIEQNEKYFDARLYRQHTIIYENDFVKDISRIGRTLNSIIIVDNMPQNFRLQKDNGIFIKPFWGDDIFDTALFSLADILENIYYQFDDVRKGIFYFKDEILNKVTSNFFKNGN